MKDHGGIKTGKDLWKYYFDDGSEPTINSERYMVPMVKKGSIKLSAFDSRRA